MQYRYGDTDVFALPGGNPDPGEDLEATLERELMEELGVDIQVFAMLFCGVVTRPNLLQTTAAQRRRMDANPGVPASPAGQPQSQATFGSIPGIYGSRHEEPRFHRQTFLA